MADVVEVPVVPAPEVSVRLSGAQRSAGPEALDVRVLWDSLELDRASDNTRGSGGQQRRPWDKLGQVG